MRQARDADRLQQAGHVRDRPVRSDRGADGGADARRLRGRARRRDRHEVPQRAASTRPVRSSPATSIVNDVSVRDWQMATPTMTMGKSWDTHGPTGPWLVTADEIDDPHDLRIRTWVDDEVRQDASTKLMITNCCGAHRLPVDGVHVAAGHDHRHRHTGRRRVRDEAAALLWRRACTCASRSTASGPSTTRSSPRTPPDVSRPRFVELDAVAAGVVEERLASGAHRFRRRHLDAALAAIGRRRRRDPRRARRSAGRGRRAGQPR